MTITLLGISGSLTRGGSTRTALDCALRAAQQGDSTVTTAVLDLRDVTLAFCDGRPLHEYPDDTPRAVAMIQAADAYIIGTPIYRGAYTGALKNLLDHVPVEALMGKVAGLIATGGSDHHYLSIDYVLRPVLMWFNMHLVPGSVYVRSQQIQGQEVVEAQVKDYLEQLGTAVVAMHHRLQGSPLGPPPLSLMARRGG
jgi:NAD(P)H-dependent FMN reductase